ncbi:RNA-directed DNA polymerase, eukaryota, reverse transcriptase zinc-binding domain protein [Tanacetum coccineum]
MGPSAYPPAQQNPQSFYRPDYQFGYPRGKGKTFSGGYGEYYSSQWTLPPAWTESGVMLVLPADPGLKWKVILLDKEFGGLGVGCLHSKNLGLLGFGVIFGGGSAFGGVWINILNAVKRIGDIDISFKKCFILKIGNGYSTSFWKDRWCGDGSRLMDMFPRLFALESFKDCKISDRWHCLDGRWCGNWAWRSPPRGRALDELASLATRIGNLTLYSDGADKWSWAGEASGIFKVKTLSKKIQNLLLNNCALGKHHCWNSLIPRKVNICVWRASLDRLPSRANLATRGVDLSSTSCPFCESVVEDIDHSLIRCPYMIKVWRKVWSWWNLGPPVSFPSFSISDIALGNISSLSNTCSRLSKVMQGVFQCSLWVIWKWRNKIVNSHSDVSSWIKNEDIFPSIQRLSKTWISARLSNLVNWNVWIARPFDLYGALGSKLGMGKGMAMAMQRNAMIIPLHTMLLG